MKPVIAALNAEYTARDGIPRNASTVETFTMLPRPAATMAGANTWVQRNTWCRLTR